MFPDAVTVPAWGVTYVPQPAPQYWRVKHDIERPGGVREIVLERDVPLPEVYRMEPLHSTVINCAWQRLWKDLNPALSGQKWSTLLGNALAWTNNTGFPGSANCILQEELEKKYPRFDQPRICGGAIVTGDVEGERLRVTTMLVGNAPPPVTSIPRHLWYYGTSVNPRGEVNYIRRQGVDGQMYPVKVPLLTTVPVYLPLADLDPIPPGAPFPDAVWLPG